MAIDLKTQLRDVEKKITEERLKGTSRDKTKIAALQLKFKEITAALAKGETGAKEEPKKEKEPEKKPDVKPEVKEAPEAPGKK